eukprot:7022952-Karenia_brevis.AAC.1
MGDTHHGGTGQSRAIDLIAVNEEMLAEAVVHNGIHCTLRGHCSWPHCCDYALSDHFLVQATVMLGWLHALSNITPALDAFSAICRNWGEVAVHELGNGRRQCSRVAQW